MPDQQKISPSLITGFGRKNILMNGNMQVFQRGTGSFTGLNSTKYVIDRWRYSAANDGAVTVTQSTDVPTGQGFPNSFKVDVTTVDTSLANDQLAHVQTAVEGQDLQHLAYGTSSAKTLTVSFWVKSNKTGTYCFAIAKPDQTRYHFIKEYTISSANTWEKKEITIEPDSNIKASGGAIDNNNGMGFRCMWVLMDGPNRDGGTDNAWQATSDVTSTDNQVNLLDSTSNEFYLTGCQLEVGDTATDFEHKNFSDHLWDCQRYYHSVEEGSGSYVQFAVGRAWGSGNANGPYKFPRVMRASPTMTAGGSASDYDFGLSGVPGAGSVTLNNDMMVINVAGSFTVGQIMIIGANADGSGPAALNFEAEL